MLWHRHVVNSVCPRIVPLVHELASSQIVLSASSLVRESSIFKLACPRKVQLPIQSVPYIPATRPAQSPMADRCVIVYDNQKSCWSRAEMMLGLVVGWLMQCGKVNWSYPMQTLYSMQGQLVWTRSALGPLSRWSWYRNRITIMRTPAGCSHRLHRWVHHRLQQLEEINGMLNSVVLPNATVTKRDVASYWP